MSIRGPLISSGKYDKALLEKHVEKMMSIYPNYKGKKEKSLLGIILSIQYTTVSALMLPQGSIFQYGFWGGGEFKKHLKKWSF